MTNLTIENINKFTLLLFFLNNKTPQTSYKYKGEKKKIHKSNDKIYKTKLNLVNL